MSDVSDSEASRLGFRFSQAYPGMDRVEYTNAKGWTLDYLPDGTWELWMQPRCTCDAAYWHGQNLEGLIAAAREELFDLAEQLPHV